VYQLMVSYDCGTHYGPGDQAETLEALEPRMHDLDERLLRWYATKDGEDLMFPVCRVHRDLLAFVQQLNEQNAEAPTPDRPGSYITATIGE